MGNNGSMICENGTVITDKDLCEETCERFNVPIANGELIDGANCYINWRKKCYQNTYNGDRASLICKKSNDDNGNELKVVDKKYQN